MQAYQQSRENRTSWWSHIRLRTLVIANALLLCAGVGAVSWNYHTGNKIWLLVSVAAATVFALAILALWLIGRLPRILKVPEAFLKPLGSLLKLPLYVYQGLLFNRINSFKMLAMNVFLKHERAMNYSSIYQDQRWNNRRIMCAVYELKTDEIAKRQQGAKALPPELVPSKRLKRLADKASAFGTTLWFTEADIRDHMLHMLIACGQATACWNLLEYIEKVKRDPRNLNAQHQLLIDQEPVIRGHWSQLQQDPFALLPKYGIQDDWKAVLGDIPAEGLSDL